MSAEDQLITPVVSITMCQPSVSPNTISDTRSCNIIRLLDMKRETDGQRVRRHDMPFICNSFSISSDSLHGFSHTLR